MNLDSLTYASRFDGVTGSAIREIFKLIAKPGMISFAGGNPARSALPDDVCAEIAKEVLQKLLKWQLPISLQILIISYSYKNPL